MSNLSDLLINGSIEQLESKRRSCVAYRNKLSNEEYTRDDRIEIEHDIITIKERIGELQNE